MTGLVCPWVPSFFPSIRTFPEVRRAHVTVRPDFQSVLDRAVNPANAAAFASPEDWRDRWIYFLMIDRFNNPLAAPNHGPFDDPSFSGFQGGKFSGVEQQLAYIKNLGAGAIWLSPALKNFPFDQNTYHGYGIHNFIAAEPRFADHPAAADDELRALVDRAHQQDLLVIFDIVLNHSGNAFAYQQDPSDQLSISTQGAQAGFHSSPQPVQWRDPSGTARPDWPDVANLSNPPLDAVVYGLRNCSTTSSFGGKAFPIATATIQPVTSAF